MTRRRLAVWKTTWLPPSQTFVLNQLDSLQHWTPVLVGRRRDPDGLDVTVERAPFNLSVPGRAADRLSAATGYRGLYDRLLRRHGVELIHAHFGPSGVEVLPIARRLGLPLIVTFHGFDVTRRPFEPDLGPRYRRGLAEVFDYASELLAVSEHLRGRLLDLGAPPEKVRVHYIGTPSRPLPDHPPGHGITFVGRLVDGKGAGDLIEAVTQVPAELLAEHPVRIVGDGPLRAELQEQARRRGAPVEFLGRLPLADVHRVLDESAVFCAPSLTGATGGSEAFGIVYLEAAQHGLPTVAYRHGGVSEAVQDGVTGLLADEGDVAGLAERLTRLLADPALAQRLGAAGTRRVADEFDIRTRTAELETIYDRVAG